MVRPNTYVWILNLQTHPSNTGVQNYYSNQKPMSLGPFN
uniref:Uncharacterized protein n=1 Tax=Arundo donax TaxID=35708 RepID=A0A0A8XNP3_ARUDO